VFLDASSASTVGMLKHPSDGAEKYSTTEYWCELAKIAERGKLNALFIANYFVYHDVNKGPDNWKLRSSVGHSIPKVDPGVLVSLMAQNTKSFSFGVTFSTIREDPALFGRRL
jgi:alkanesulfonate monooxygenase SsuD/methylene tetrahydromethanopterin reductase-like flavin-dependent oxidoreductase (luciferase family)